MTVKPITAIIMGALICLGIYLFGYCKGSTHGIKITEIKNHMIIDSLSHMKDTISINVGRTIRDTIYKLKIEYRDNKIKLTELQRSFQKQLDSLKKTKVDSVFITKLKIVYDTSQTIKLCDTPALQIFHIDTVLQNKIKIKATISTLGYLLGTDLSAEPGIFIVPPTAKRYTISAYFGSAVGIGVRKDHWSLTALKSIYSTNWNVIAGYNIDF